jgi:hypothetical protein
MAIADERFDLDGGGKLAERGFREGKAGDNEDFSRAHDDGQRGILRNGRQCGHVTAADVFGERELDGAADFFWIERLHRRKMVESSKTEKGKTSAESLISQRRWVHAAEVAVQILYVSKIDYLFHRTRRHHIFWFWIDFSGFGRGFESGG